MFKHVWHKHVSFSRNKIPKNCRWFVWEHWRFLLKSIVKRNASRFLGISFLKNQTCLEAEIRLAGVFWHSQSERIFVTWNSDWKVAIQQPRALRRSRLIIHIIVGLLMFLAIYSTTSGFPLVVFMYDFWSPNFGYHIQFYWFFLNWAYCVKYSEIQNLSSTLFLRVVCLWRNFRNLGFIFISISCFLNEIQTGSDSTLPPASAQSCGSSMSMKRMRRPSSESAGPSQKRGRGRPPKNKEEGASTPASVSVLFFHLHYFVFIGWSTNAN